MFENRNFIRLRLRSGIFHFAFRGVRAALACGGDAARIVFPRDGRLDLAGDALRPAFWRSIVHGASRKSRAALEIAILAFDCQRAADFAASVELCRSSAAAKQ